MKPLFFSHQADFLYGGEICTLSFIEALKRKGIQSHFASPDGPYFDRAKTWAVCHPVSSIQFRRSILQVPALVFSLIRTHFQLKAVIRENDITVLHATSLKAMVFACFLKSIPVIWHHHDILPSSLSNRLWLRFLSSRASLILVPSRSTKEALVKAGVPTKKCEVLHNGFPLKAWKKRGPRTSVFRLAMIGEISERKGSDCLQNILRKIQKKTSLEQIQVQVIGSGLSDPDFAHRIRRELKDFPVEFLGRREDVKELLQSIDLLLVPSRQDPLPTVIVEAFLSGVPVVGRPVGGIPEMILEGKNGFLASSEEEFSSAILQAREVGLWNILSGGAREFAEKNFDIDLLTDQLLAVYHKLEKT